MKKMLMTSLSVCSLGVSCNEMSDTLMLLVVNLNAILRMTICHITYRLTYRSSTDR